MIASSEISSSESVARADGVFAEYSESPSYPPGSREGTADHLTTRSRSIVAVMSIDWYGFQADIVNQICGVLSEAIPA